MTVEKEHVIKLRLTDFTRYGHLSPSAVLDIFQDLATEQSIDMGVGLDALYAKGLIWVVVRQKIEFQEAARFAKPHQQVRVRTWPHSPSRLGFLRDYALYNMQGDIMVAGTSEWLLLNFEDRKFVSVLDVYDGPTDFSEDRAIPGKLRKVKDFETPAGEEPIVVVPQFTDIDTNQHVNNARYLNYIMNTLPQNPDQALKSIQIDYRKELALGEPVRLYSLVDEVGTHVKGIMQDEEGADAVSFNCLLTYA